MDSQKNAVITNPDFLALGMGGTNMMSMLWTVAMGRKAVGVEMRGDPFLGVHWNIREDLYHQLGLIDQLMEQHYGEERLPRRGDGRIFRLAECFYTPYTTAGDIVADEIIDGFDKDQHIVGTIHNVEFIDDRWRDGLPNRVITVLDPPKPPSEPDPAKIRTSMVEVLDGPSTFQAEAASIQKLLRRYLELIEKRDEELKCEPRVQLFTHHRVVTNKDDGFVTEPDGRKRIRIESLKEFDFKGQFVRVREPNSETIDLGVPELFMIAQGFNSHDARRLGFEQKDVEVDHEDGRGPVVAQADFLAGLVEVLVGGRLRRRISSVFDPDGKEYWVRGIAVGHENDPEVGWVLVQVPDFKTFDPIASGVLPIGTDTNSPEFFASYQQLIYDFYIKQAAEILEISPQELKKVQMIYGPTLFSLIERVGDDALVAPNGVVAGDSFGNGHFLTSGGAMTGMIGHSYRVLKYWQDRDAGITPTIAVRELADKISEDTHAWLHVSAKEYSEAAPINFGAERIQQISKASGIESSARSHAIDAARRLRHALIPLDPSNWRRLFIRNGKVLSILPELENHHPMQRPEREASLLMVMKSFPVIPRQVNAQITSDTPLVDATPLMLEMAAPMTAAPMAEALPPVAEADQTMLKAMPSAQMPQSASPSPILNPLPALTPEAKPAPLNPLLPLSSEIHEAEQTIIRPRIMIGKVIPEHAKMYAFLDIQKPDMTVQRVSLKTRQLVIGRADPNRGINPDIDLTPFDASNTVSRQHARISLEPDRFSIEDLKSRNKTKHGEAPLNPHQPARLKDGDTISFGSVRATFRLLGNSELPEPWSPS